MNVVEVDSVSKWFGPLKVLDRVSMKVRRSEKVVLVGPNGAGKTTLIRIVVGSLKPDEGSVRVAVRRNSIGYAPQIPIYYPFHRVFDVIYYSLKLVGFDDVEARRRTKEWVSLLGLDPNALGIHLSGGERKLVALAIAMARDPELLILDEPTEMLDISRKKLVREVISRYEGSAIIVTHNLEEVKLGNRLYFLHSGRMVFEGSPAEFALRLGGRNLVVEVWTVRGLKSLTVKSLSEALESLKTIADDEVVELRVRRAVPEDLSGLIGERG